MKRTERLFATVLSVLILAGGSAMAARRTASKTTAVKGVVNINQAPLSKLVLLPYVGKGKAKAIIRYRSSKKFQKASDLIRVAGIGRATFVKIKAHVRVSGPTTIQRIRPASRRKGRSKGSRSGRQRRKPGSSR